MEKKTARLTVLIDPDKKKALEELCLQQDVTPSQVIRQLIRTTMSSTGSRLTLILRRPFPPVFDAFRPNAAEALALTSHGYD